MTEQEKADVCEVEALDDHSGTSDTYDRGNVSVGSDVSHTDNGKSGDATSSSDVSDSPPKKSPGIREVVHKVRDFVLSPVSKSKENLADKFDSAAIDDNQKTKSGDKKGLPKLSKNDQIIFENAANLVARKGGICPQTAMTKTNICKNSGKDTKTMGRILDQGVEYEYLGKVKNKRYFNYYAIKYNLESE